jgi:succinate dehydrogenase / fumarate reductase cytochrome b subunit
MSATAVDSRLNRALRFYQASIGKKAIMAVTGVILFGFLIGHVLGNLQFFAGAEKINGYSEFLHHSTGILWGTRVVLLVSVILHVTAAFQLYAQKARARPVAYAKKAHAGSRLASRTMLWSGIAILLFVPYHLLHFTFGWSVVHPNFVEGDVFANLRTAFASPVVAGIYIVAMVLLANHLMHGLWSMFQSVGVAHPRWTPGLRHFAVAFAIVLAAAFATIPVAVLLGFAS